MAMISPGASRPPSRLAPLTSEEIKGTGEETCSVTGTVSEPAVTAPLYDPTARPLGFTATVRVAGNVALAGLTVSHAAALEAVAVTAKPAAGRSRPMAGARAMDLPIGR